MATLRWAPVVSTMGAEVGLFHSTAWPPCAKIALAQDARVY